MPYIEELKNISSIGIIKLNNEEEVLCMNSLAEEILRLNSHVNNRNLKELAPLLYEGSELKTEIEVGGKHLILERHNCYKYSLILIFNITSVKTCSSTNIDRIMKTNGTYYSFKSIIGNNKDFRRSIDFARKIARNNSSVLILGETGTGKELFAQSIHNASNFSDGPFIAVNCAAIPDTLLESVLFGTVKGAFTGAKDNEGLISQADNGTIFLDEINSMNLNAQAKLLRFLQDRNIRSVGDNKQRKISCRVISAVNRDIEQEIKSNKLREDLYYRLATVTLHIPPLTQRKDDIPLLVKSFIKKYRDQFNTNIEKLDDDLLNLFMEYNWPGNVRELEHVIESAMNMVEPSEKTLKRIHLSTHLLQKFLTINTSDNREESPESYSSQKHLNEILDEVERQVIIERLEKYEGNITQAAKDLGIFRQALQYRIKKHEIEYQEP